MENVGIDPSYPYCSTCGNYHKGTACPVLFTLSDQDVERIAQRVRELLVAKKDPVVYDEFNLPKFTRRSIK